MIHRSLQITVLIGSLLVTGALSVPAGTGGAGVIVSIDTITSGNGAQAVGAIDRCRAVSTGEPFEIDVVIQDVSDLAGFQADLIYETSAGVSILTITEVDYDFLLATAPGAGVVDLGSDVPDSDGEFLLAVIVFSIVRSVSVDGSGVLARLDVRADAPGVSELRLENVKLADASAEPIPVAAVNNASIAVGGLCTDSDPDPAPESPPATPSTPPAATPATPTPTPSTAPPGSGGPLTLTWGDLNCDDGVDAVDALAGLRYVAALSPLAQDESCPDIGSSVGIGSGPRAETAGTAERVWGDVECSDQVDVVDSLALLRYVAGLSPLPGNESCPEIGGLVIVSDPLAGGVLATFQAVAEQFRVWVTNPNTIDQLFALEAGQSNARIPNARVHRGPGRGNHNAPWSWHMDPEEMEMAEVTIELCDARPSFVEENLDYFVDVVRHYCPWSAELISLTDYR
jgi:hypothetical protein